MNDWQLIRQMAYLVRSATWSGGGALFMPSSVVVTVGLAQEAGSRLSLPCCLIGPGDPQSDPEFGEEPGLLVETIVLKVMAAVPNDPIGTAPLMGANRTAATAGGKGVLEVVERLLSFTRRLSDADGVRLQSARKGGATPQTHPDLGYVVWQEIRCELVATDAKSFHKPTRFVATGGSGQVAMTWKLPPTRFDYRRCILRRASGATPPATVADGTGVTLGGTPDGVSAVSKTDSGLSAGTYSYSLFAAYNDYSVNASTGADAPTADTTSAGDLAYSPAVSRAGIVVT